MRDPSRIPDILDRIAEVWEEMPDMRLGQLILNVVRDPNVLYNMEDEILIDRLEKLYG